jgi:hypothetical protein
MFLRLPDKTARTKVDVSRIFEAASWKASSGVIGIYLAR